MPTLMDLPNEILISIINATESENIESFSTCCKLMHRLARHRLEEHKGKKSNFSTIFVKDDFVPLPKPLCGTKYNKSSDQLREFFSDERNRFYPKAMVVNLPAGGNRFLNEHDAIDGLDEVEQQLECRMAEVNSMMGLDIGGIEAEEWGKHIKAGDPTAMLLLLLALLPNLEKLSVHNMGYLPRTLSASYWKIMRLMTEAALEQKKDGLSFGGKLSQCKLTGNFFEHTETSLVPFFMVLPSMRAIQGVELDMEDWPWLYAGAVSPVVDLDLNGAIGAVTLINYIHHIRELKRLRFHYRYDEEIGWKPRGIVTKLRQVASKSLVHLDLTIDVSTEMGWFDSSLGIGSLRSFEVLETVRLQDVLLYEEVRTADSAERLYSTKILGKLFDNSLVKGQILIDFLPSSVRCFQLEDIVNGRLILDTLKGFPEHRAKRLPNLELILLEAGDEINSQIEGICKKSGVQMRSSKKNSPFPKYMGR